MRCTVPCVCRAGVRGRVCQCLCVCGCRPSVFRRSHTLLPPAHDIHDRCPRRVTTVASSCGGCGECVCRHCRPKAPHSQCGIPPSVALLLAPAAAHSVASPRCLQRLGVPRVSQRRAEEAKQAEVPATLTLKLAATVARGIERRGSYLQMFLFFFFATTYLMMLLLQRQTTNAYKVENTHRGALFNLATQTVEYESGDIQPDIPDVATLHVCTVGCGCRLGLPRLRLTLPFHTDMAQIQHCGCAVHRPNVRRRSVHSSIGKGKGLLLLFVVCCLLFVVDCCCLLFIVVCCLLFVVCCLLFVVCCLFVVVYSPTVHVCVSLSPPHSLNCAGVSVRSHTRCTAHPVLHLTPRLFSRRPCAGRSPVLDALPTAALPSTCPSSTSLSGTPGAVVEFAGVPQVYVTCTSVWQLQHAV